MSGPDKHISDFELFEPNLIPETSIEYAYTFKKSNRLIQKANEADLLAAIQKNWQDIGYVKMGEDQPFRPIEAIDALHKPIVVQKITKLKRERIMWPIYILIMGALNATNFQRYYEENNSTILFAVLYLALMVFMVVLFSYRISRLKRELTEG